MADNIISEEERILAAAVRYLLEGGEKEAARILMTGEVQHCGWDYLDDYRVWHVAISGSRQLYDYLQYDSLKKEPIGISLKKALEAAIGSPLAIDVTMAPLDIDLDWRARLLAEIETETPLNQNSFAKSFMVWNSIRFNSEPEIKVAQALERAGVMYIPNCLVRAGSPGAMVSRFPDFLICYRGKWGILEVDGQKFHVGRATEDHERSRIIERHGGITYLTRFDYQRCLNDPDGVVRDFLEILQSK